MTPLMLGGANRSFQNLDILVTYVQVLILKPPFVHCAFSLETERKQTIIIQS